MTQTRAPKTQSGELLNAKLVALQF